MRTTAHSCEEPCTKQGHAAHHNTSSEVAAQGSRQVTSDMSARLAHTLQQVDMSAYTDSRSERLKRRWSTVDSFRSNQLHMQSVGGQQAPAPAPPQHPSKTDMQGLAASVLLHVSGALFPRSSERPSSSSCRQCPAGSALLAAQRLLSAGLSGGEIGWEPHMWMLMTGTPLSWDILLK